MDTRATPRHEPHAEPLVHALRRDLVERGVAARLVETHISWVLLAGEFAYKVKKPVRFGFLDFSSPSARHHCCIEEVRLNRRLAPDLYLGVVPIRQGPAGPTLDGEDGPVLEHAVKMRRFPAGSLGSERLARGQLEGTHLAAFAQRLGAFHAAAAAAPSDSPFGSARTVRAQIRATFSALRLAVEPAALAALRAAVDRDLAHLAATIDARRAAGRVREGHGDLHLDNVVVLDGHDLTAFDGIEFDPALRWIDVMSDVGFLLMDLLAHGRRDLAATFLNEYLECTGDYEGLAVLRLYTVWRALVRCLVASLQERGGATVEHRLRARDYFALAQRLEQAPPGRLMITHGLPGSGKSHLTRQLLERSGAVRVRSDVERQRLFGPEGRYDESATAATYRRLADVAADGVRAGWDVIVDAAFLRREQRDAMRRVAADAGVAFAILDCQAPMAVLRERVHDRHAAGIDASEADVTVLEHLARVGEPLGPDERAHTVAVSTDEPVAVADLLRRWGRPAATSAESR